MKQISTLSIRNSSSLIKACFASLFFFTVSLATAQAQTGYLYVHTKALSEDLNQSFTFSVSGGTTSVANFTLLDQQVNIEPTDIGAGHGTGAGELWVVAGATQGADGAIYHRAVNSTTWNMISGQTGGAIDGADLGHFVITNANGDAYLYNGTAFILIFDHTIYNAKAVDIASNGSITAASGYLAIVDKAGHVWKYTGNFTTTFTWLDITPVSTSGGKFSRIDVNPVTNDIILVDNNAYVTKVNSNGTGLVYYNRPAGAPGAIDIAVDNFGNIYSMGKDVTGLDAAYRYSGSTWTEEPETGLHYFLTCSDAGQAWVIKGATASQSSSFANPSTIYTRMGDGSGSWLDDERVQTAQNDNAIMIPVAPGTYTITEANVSNWNLQGIVIYDSTSGSTTNVAGNSATIVVSAGQVAHVMFTNGLVAPSILPNTCGTTTLIQNFGLGLASRGNALTGLTDFHFYSDASKNTTPDGYYSLSQNSSQWGNSSLTDHTGLPGGYFMIINASYAPNAFYRHRLTGLITGATYVLSFWAANLSPSSPLQPNILAGITDTASGTILGSVSTGSLPTDKNWHQYTFVFKATLTTGDVFLRNNAQGGFGNDLAIDDISLSGLCNVLPVTIVNFSAEKKQSDVLVKWTTTAQLNFDHFDIERSNDAASWKSIGEVAGDGTNVLIENYSFTDQQPANGDNYYRLKEVDKDGTTVYSEIKMVQFTGATQWNISVYPNPASGGNTVKLQSNEPLQMIRIFDISGKLMAAQNIPATETATAASYSLNTSNLAQGMYFVQAADTKGNTSILKLVKKD